MCLFSPLEDIQKVKLQHFSLRKYKIYLVLFFIQLFENIKNS